MRFVMRSVLGYWDWCRGDSRGVGFGMKSCSVGEGGLGRREWIMVMTVLIG